MTGVQTCALPICHVHSGPQSGQSVLLFSRSERGFRGRSAATIIAPLWEINAIFPFGVIICENDPFNGVCESVIPKLFGPIMFIPYSSPSFVNSASNLAPSSPTSLKPAVITTMFLTPTSPQSRTVSFTKTERIVIIAKSTVFGMSFILAYAVLPRISPLFGFTGYISLYNYNQRIFVHKRQGFFIVNQIVFPFFFNFRI